jgi:hypothetical protein
MKFKTYEQFKKAYGRLSARRKLWLADKCRWERMTAWAAMNEWTVPASSKLRADGGTR